MPGSPGTNASHYMNAKELHAILQDLDGAPVECDGMARLVATRLHASGIAYQAYLGRLDVGAESVEPHYWLKVDGFLIDYRARMWLGDNLAVPHGVFEPGDYSQARYTGNAVTIAPLKPGLFKALLTPF